MRWLIDECVDAELAVRLRQAGHDVIYMSEVAPRTRDSEVLSRAERENRLLLTEDKDFGELIFRQSKPVSGIVLMRIDPLRRLRKPVRLLRLNVLRTRCSVGTQLSRMPASARGLFDRGELERSTFLVQ